MLTPFRSLCALSVVALLATPTFAAISYQFVTDQTTYTVAPGGTATVLVSLQENLSGGSSSLLDADGGLANFVFNTNLLSGSNMSVTNQARNSSFSGGLPTINEVLAENIIDGATATASAPGGAGLVGAAGNTGVTLPVDSNQILLGTLTITVPSNATNSVFKISDNDPGYADTFTFQHDYILNLPSTDPLQPADTPTYTTSLASGITFNVDVQSSVPEPASIGLLALGSLGLLIRKRRRSV